jgi:hypothetical protein
MQRITIPGFRWVIATVVFAATAVSFSNRQALWVLALRITAELGMDNIAYSRVVLAFILSHSVMFTVGGRSPTGSASVSLSRPGLPRAFFTPQLVNAFHLGPVPLSVGHW